MSMTYGVHGRVLKVDLSSGTHEVLEVETDVYRQFLGGYGLGAWLMWHHYPAGVDPLRPEACFALVSGLLTGTHTPFSGRTQIVGKSPLTGSWADSNSGGSVAMHLREAGFEALIVTGRAPEPSVLVVRDDEVIIAPAGELWGREIPETFDHLKEEYGGKSEVGVSAIGPAGERQARIAAVLNDRYHAFGRQGFGAIYGSKNLKAVVIGGTGKVPIHDRERFDVLCQKVNRTYKSDLSRFMRFMVWTTKTKLWFGWVYRLLTRLGIKADLPQATFRQAFSDRGTTLGLALSTENGDAPVRNWAGVGTRDFPLRRALKIDGEAVHKTVTKKLSCGSCPAPCKGIVGIKKRGLSDVRRPDYETLAGFGANLLNDDLGIVTACHDACNRYGFDALSSAATLGWVCEAVEKGALTAADLDGIDMRWGDGEAALALTIKIGTGEGCGAWLQHGVAAAAAHVGKGSDAYAVHVHGQEPAWHDPRFTPMMGINYIADPSPGRHTSGSGSWQETFNTGFPLPKAGLPKDELTVSWKSHDGKGQTQAHYSNAHQVLNGLGLCMFTGLTGNVPWRDLLDAVTGWGMSEADLLESGERIQMLRQAFNVREGLKPADFKPHPRMMGQGDGKLDAGPLRDIEVPLLELREAYFAAMDWDPETGRPSRSRAAALGLEDLLAPVLAE